MRSRNVVVGLVASLVTVALAIGLLLVVDATADDEVELPDRIGDLRAIDTDGSSPARAVPDGVGERQRRADEVNADGYSEVLDGAAADARVYLDPGSAEGELVSVVAVAGDLGPLVPQDGFVDPEQLGFALPQTERVTDGDVECLLLRDLPPRAGTDYQPDQAEPDAIFCQQRSGTLTVRVRSVTGNLAALVNVVTDVWDELD